MTAHPLRPGDIAVHKKYGRGTVRNISYSPLTRQPLRVDVTFLRGTDILTVRCWADDLSPQTAGDVPVTPPPPRGRPMLRVVPPVRL